MHLLNKVSSNQIENTALGSVMLEGDIAELVQRATILELERNGVNLGNGKITILGRIKEFKVDDLGYSADWSYIINYQLVEVATGGILLDKDYSATPKRVSKFTLTLQKLIDDVNAMIYSGYEKFINDYDVRKILIEKSK